MILRKLLISLKKPKPLSDETLSSSRKGSTCRFFVNSKRALRVILFFVFGGSVGLLILLLAATAVLLWIKREYQDRVYPNVFIFSTSVAGKTGDELDELLIEKDKEVANQKVIFTWENNVQKTYEINPQMISFSIDKEATKNNLLKRGRAEQGIKSLIEAYQLLVSPQEVEPKFKYDKERLAVIVSQMRQEIDRPAQDALFEFKGGKVVNFQVSKEGKEVDGVQVEAQVAYIFKSLPFQKPLTVLKLPVKPLLPRVKTEDTNSLGLKEFLAEGESFFEDSISTRVYNIILASSYLHGTVVPPGEIFSFSEKIGTISAETGYKKAYVIKERKTILEDGGGVCQVSTTLFRAALNAGLPIIERHPHYYRVGYYEQRGYPPGLDATVYPPSPDFKFKNDTPSYILIQTKVDQEKKRLAFEFYGTSDGRTIEMAKPIIHSQTPPPEPVYVDEPSLAKGVVKRIDTAHWGAKVSFTRKVWDLNGELKEEQVFWSDYVPWPAVYQRGTG